MKCYIYLLCWLLSAVPLQAATNYPAHARDSLFFRIIRPEYTGSDYAKRVADYLGDPGYYLELYRTRIKRAPNTVHWRWKLVDLLERIGDSTALKVAVADLRRVIYRQGSRAWRKHNFWYHLARSYAAQGKYAQSIKWHLVSYNKNRKWTGNLFRISLMYLKLAQPESAATYLKKYLAARGIRWLSRSWMLHWEAFYRRTAQPARAVALYRRFVQRYPVGSWGFRRIMDLLTPDQISLVPVLARQYLKKNKKDVENLHTACSWFTRFSLHKEALAFLAAYRQTYNNPQQRIFFRLLVARIREAAGQYGKAARIYRVLLEKRPPAIWKSGEYSYYLIKLVRTLLRGGKRDQAFTLLRRRMGAAPLQAERALLLAEDALLQKKWQAARRILVTHGAEPSGSWKNNDFLFVRRLTLLLERYGKPKLAAYFWRKLVARNPNPEILLAYGRFLGRRKNPVPAFRFVLRAYREAPYLRKALPDIVCLATEAKLYRQAYTYLQRMLVLFDESGTRERLGKDVFPVIIKTLRKELSVFLN